MLSHTNKYLSMCPRILDSIWSVPGYGCCKTQYKLNYSVQSSFTDGNLQEPGDGSPISFGSDFTSTLHVQQAA